MKCPYCNSANNHVIDSRAAGAHTRRRRHCENCGKNFGTYEMPVLRSKPIGPYYDEEDTRVRLLFFADFNQIKPLEVKPLRDFNKILKENDNIYKNQ